MTVVGVGVVVVVVNVSLIGSVCALRKNDNWN